MTTRVVSRVTISDSPKSVFKYLADSSYHFLWNPHLHTLKPMGQLKQGSSYETMSLFLGVKILAKNKVTKYLDAKELQLENNTGTLKYTVNYRLEPSSRQTILVCTTQVQADGTAFAFTKPILKLLARRELQSDLGALKLAVEQQLG